MMDKSFSKSLLMAALITGTVLWGGNSVFAQENEQEFTLDPMVITAQRTEMRDLDTPATVEVVTKEEIKKAGYKNVFDAVEHQLGMTSTGYGDAGASFGLSQGRTTIRGFDRGTLVMVDGIPMNLKNYNTVDSVPVEMVDRIEIVKGAAGTLYGAEAMGGVVNIITKRPDVAKEEVTLRGTVGNYYKDYNVALTSKDFMISAGKEYSDEYNNSNDFPDGSDTDWWVGKGQRNRLSMIGNLNEEVRAMLFYSDGEVTRGGHKYGSKPKDYDYEYKDKRLTAGLTYTGQDNGVKATLGYNYIKYDGFDYIKNSKVSSNSELDSYIGDIQKKWDFGKDSLIAGYTFKRENYEGLVDTSRIAHRTSNALYLSYDKWFGDKFKTTLGLRGEKYSDYATDDNILLPQIQTLYKFDDTSSWYINIGKAFQMPAVDAYFGGYSFNNIEPEEGWNYETGFKKVDGNKSYKLAVYHMDFENKLGWSDDEGPDGKKYPVNKGDFRNTGVELEMTNRVDDNWSYRLGVGYGNPEIKDPSAKNPKWVQDAGRVDFVAGLTYSQEKLKSNLTFKYLGDREDYKARQIPARARLTWNTTYDFTKNDSVTVTFNNLLDRENYSNRYGNLDLPFNWRVMYTHTF